MHPTLACSNNQALEVHHIHYETLWEEDPQRDLITLCSDCHDRLHVVVNDYIEESKHIKSDYIAAVREAMIVPALDYYERASNITALASNAFLGKRKTCQQNHFVKIVATMLGLENATQIPVKCPSIRRPASLGGNHSVCNDANNKLSDMRKRK